MKLKNIFILSFLMTLFYSCNLINDTPDTVFQLVGLNANKIPKSFQRVFKEYREQKINGKLKIPASDNKTMKPATCVEAVNYFYSNTFTADIEKIKKLNVTDDAKPIIAAGLELFEYAQEIQKNDFPKIAKMIDDGKSEEEINLAAKNLDDTKGIELDKKQEKMMKLLLPYANENGVEYKQL